MKKFQKIFCIFSLVSIVQPVFAQQQAIDPAVNNTAPTTSTTAQNNTSAQPAASGDTAYMAVQSSMEAGALSAVQSSPSNTASVASSVAVATNAELQAVLKTAKASTEIQKAVAEASYQPNKKVPMLNVIKAADVSSYCVTSSDVSCSKSGSTLELTVFSPGNKGYDSARHFYVKNADNDYVISSSEIHHGNNLTNAYYDSKGRLESATSINYNTLKDLGGLEVTWKDDGSSEIKFEIKSESNNTYLATNITEKYSANGSLSERITKTNKANFKLTSSSINLLGKLETTTREFFDNSVLRKKIENAVGEGNQAKNTKVDVVSYFDEKGRLSKNPPYIKNDSGLYASILINDDGHTEQNAMRARFELTQKLAPGQKIVVTVERREAFASATETYEVVPTTKDGRFYQADVRGLKQPGATYVFYIKIIDTDLNKTISSVTTGGNAPVPPTTQFSGSIFGVSINRSGANIDYSSSGITIQNYSAKSISIKPVAGREVHYFSPSGGAYVTGANLAKVGLTFKNESALTVTPSPGQKLELVAFAAKDMPAGIYEGYYEVTIVDELGKATVSQYPYSFELK